MRSQEQKLPVEVEGDLRYSDWPFAATQSDGSVNAKVTVINQTTNWIIQNKTKEQKDSELNMAFVRMKLLLFSS